MLTFTSGCERVVFATGTAADGGAGGPEVQRAGAVPAAGSGVGEHVRSTGGRSGGRETGEAGRGGRPQAAGSVSPQRLIQ